VWQTQLPARQVPCAPEQLVVAHGSDGSIGAVRLSTEAFGSLIGAASTSSGNAATNLIHHAHISTAALLHDF